MISKWLTLMFYPDLYNSGLPYAHNSSKLIIRYFTIVFALGSVMGNQQHRVIFLRVLLIAGFMLVILKQFNLMGSSSTMGFATSMKTATGGVIEYSWESFGFMDKNYFAILLGINLILAIGYYSLTKNFITRYVFLPVIIILSCIQLALSMSLGGIISSLGGIGVLLYYRGKTKKWYYIAIPIVASIFIMIFREIAFSKFFIERIIGLYDSILPAFSGGKFYLNELAHTTSSSLTTRIGSAFYAFDIFMESPIFGYGGYKDLTSPLGSGTHTTYIAWLTNFGLITFIPLLFFIREVFVILRKRILNLINKSNDFHIQVIAFAIFILLIINGFGSPIMHYLIIFTGFSLYAEHK